MIRVPHAMCSAAALIGALALARPLPSQEALTVTREFLLPTSGLGVANAVVSVEGDGLVAVGYADLGLGRGSDVVLVRFDAAGDTVWTRSYGGPRAEFGWDVVADDGGFYIVGFVEAPTEGQEDILVMRVGPAGEPQWERTFGGTGRDRAWSATLAPGGGIVIAAESEDVERGERDAYVLHVDRDGAVRWERRVEASGDQRVYHIARTSDDAFVVTGTSGSDGDAPRDVYVVRVNAAGAVEWERTFGGPPDDVGHGVLALDGGDVLVTGYGVTRSNGGTDVYLLHLDPSGSPRFWEHHGGVDSERAMMSAMRPGGGYVSVGFSFGSTGADIVVLESDVAGNALRWTTFPRPGDDRGIMILARPTGAYVLAGTVGRSRTSPGSFAVWWLANRH